MTLVRTNESKNILKKYEELTQMIIMKNIKKIKLNWDADLPLMKTLELRNMIILPAGFFK